MRRPLRRNLVRDFIIEQFGKWLFKAFAIMQRIIIQSGLSQKLLMKKYLGLFLSVALTIISCRKKDDTNAIVRYLQRLNQDNTPLAFF